MAATGNLLVDIKTPQPDDSVKSGASVMLDQAKALTITSAAEYAVAATALANIKGRWKAVDAEREELKAPSLEGCRRVDNFFRPPLTALKEAEDIVKAKLDAYDKEQKRLAAIEQARLDEIARKERERVAEAARREEAKTRALAEDARRRAEEQRYAAEQARRREEDARRAGDVAAAEEAQREAAKSAQAASRLETKASATEQRGAERAELLSQQAASVVAPVVQVNIPKVAGLSSRKNYKARVTDLMKLVKAIAEGKAPLAYVVANESVLDKMAKALKQQMDIPGVELVEDSIKASGAA